MTGTSLFGPRQLMPVVRATVVNLFLVVLAGFGMLVASVVLPDEQPRPDGFLVLPGGDRAVVHRFNLPDQWRLEFRPARHGTVQAVYDPSRRFAFRITLVDPPASVEDFARGRANGERVERFADSDATPAAVSVALMRGNTLSFWGVETQEFTRLTFAAVNRGYGLQCDLLPADEERLLPVARRLFLSAETLSPDDPRADSAVKDLTRVAWKEWLAWWGWRAFGVGGVLLMAVMVLGIVLQVQWTLRGMLAPRPLAGHGVHPQALARPNEFATAITQLAELGFVSDGWFVLEDVGGQHLGTWHHPGRPDVALLFVSPMSGLASVRFVRRFADGCLLGTSNRRADLAYDPPPGVSAQWWKGATVPELWEKHLDALAAFVDSDAPPSGPASAVALYQEWQLRVVRHHVSYTLWFLRYDPFGEWLHSNRWAGVSVAEQVARGWVVTPARGT